MSIPFFALFSSNPSSLLNLYKRLLTSVKPYRLIFLLGILGTAASSGIDAGLAWLIKPIINHGLVDKNFHFIRILPFVVILIFILRGFAVFMSTYYIAKVGKSVVMDFRQQMFAHMLRLPASFYDTQSSGQLLSRLIFNVEQVTEATTNALMIMVQDGVLAIGLIVVMISLSWQMTLMFMVILPMLSIMIRYTSKRMRRLSFSVQKAMGEISHIAEESFEGYRVIRTFGGEDYENNKFVKATKDNRRREMKIVATNAIGTATTQIIVSFAIALILFLATLPQVDISPGTFAALIASMFALLRPIRRITQINNSIQKGVAGAQSIFEILDIEPEKDTGTLTVQRVKGAIEYRDLRFTYPHTKKQVLSEINFHIKPGETVALVGRSGSGKTTLVSLLPRFYELEKGSILIDGVDIREFRLADLRNQFALVSQHVTLFNDTIARNIGYGRLSEVSEEDIIRAAEAAHAMDFIREFPQGLNTLIGENGVLLSGGQRQRIAIARALLKNSPILILDEATSSLDTESERRIQAALDDLMRHRTTLVIAHRLSTIEKADRILVVEKGRIVETGTHAELVRNNGHYAYLHALQFKDEPATSDAEVVVI
ncbi:MAG TPA: lipid A export permease/ATP-binding protein MsbA [Gammaproteobacteria bacterium]|nr:lipid A export permease/ATP-binding protein MsbA [Gammaproteobacteria bacterium]